MEQSEREAIERVRRSVAQDFDRTWLAAGLAHRCLGEAISEAALFKIMADTTDPLTRDLAAELAAERWKMHCAEEAFANLEEDACMYRYECERLRKLVPPRDPFAEVGVS